MLMLSARLSYALCLLMLVVEVSVEVYECAVSIVHPTQDTITPADEGYMQYETRIIKHRGDTASGIARTKDRKRRK